METNFFLTTEGIVLSTVIILSIMYIVFLFSTSSRKVYILAGRLAVSHFKNEYWYNLEIILSDNLKGEIIIWNQNNDRIEVLLGKLKGYHNFIILTEEDIEKIEEHTNLKIK